MTPPNLQANADHYWTMDEVRTLMMFPIRWLVLAFLIPTAACAPRIPGPGPSIRGYVTEAYALRWVDIAPGQGPVAESGQQVTVHYTGWLANGKQFDSSREGQPITFTLGGGQVIMGWDNGLEGMRVGGRRRLFIPYQLGYGASAQGDAIPAKSDLTFDVELIAIKGEKPSTKKP